MITLATKKIPPRDRKIRVMHCHVCGERLKDCLSPKEHQALLDEMNRIGAVKFQIGEKE